MFMTLFFGGAILLLVALTAWGSYRHYAGIRHKMPLWRLVTVDTLRRTVPITMLTVTVTTLMSMGPS